MKKTNAQSIGEVLRNFFEDNTEIYENMMDARARRAWNNVLGAMATQYTRSIFVKDHILHVNISSSVLRNELLLSKEMLINKLNGEIGSTFITDIIIR